MKPYPKYKDSGVEWIGEIPEHWDSSPLFAVLKERFVKNLGNQEQNVLSLSYGNIIRRDVSDNFGLIPESFETYQIVEPGDIVLRLTDLQNDKRSLRAGLVKERGIITSAYVALCCGENTVSHYVYRLLHSYDITKVFYAMGGGVRQTLGYSELRKLPILVPPETEQNTIARFLDAKTRQIDELVEKKRKQIELLKEYRSSVISEAVTKGLNPNAKMKDSGVEWIGEIPEHWEVRRIKYDTYINRLTLSEDEDPELDLKYIDIGSVDSQGNISSPEMYLFRNAPSRARRIVTSGATLFSTVRTYLKAIAFIADADKNLIASTGFAVLEAKHGLSPKYIYYATSVSYFVNKICSISTGVSYPATTSNAVGNTDIYKPPLAEQDAITRFLDEKTAQIDALIQRSESQIEQLKSYRTSLISEAVTGKIDARDWQEAG